MARGGGGCWWPRAAGCGARRGPPAARAFLPRSIWSCQNLGRPPADWRPRPVMDSPRPLGRGLAHPGATPRHRPPPRPRHRAFHPTPRPALGPPGSPGPPRLGAGSASPGAPVGVRRTRRGGGGGASRSSPPGEPPGSERWNGGGVPPWHRAATRRTPTHRPAPSGAVGALGAQHRGRHPPSPAVSEPPRSPGGDLCAFQGAQSGPGAVMRSRGAAPSPWGAPVLRSPQPPPSARTDRGHSDPAANRAVARRSRGADLRLLPPAAPGGVDPVAADPPLPTARARVPRPVCFGDTEPRAGTPREARIWHGGCPGLGAHPHTGRASGGRGQGGAVRTGPGPRRLSR